MGAFAPFFVANLLWQTYFAKAYLRLLNKYINIDSPDFSRTGDVRVRAARNICLIATRTLHLRVHQMIESYQAVFPNKPSGMSEAAYSFHRQNGQCARLLRGECQIPCDEIDGDGNYSVDFDHVDPASNGGESSDWNLEPKCSSYNRWVKRDGQDPRFSQTSFFDNPISPICLRENQNSYGYGLVKGVYRPIFQRPSNSLQRSYMLLAWIVGSGKTIGMVSILHGINEVINDVGAARPRIFKVLWLVHRESIVKSIMEEVKTEPTKYGILQEDPNVSIIEDASDWDAATPNADYVFACTQSLWNTRNASLDIESRRQKLSRFDAIVIDECHYGVDKFIEILNLAPHALKFVMSATPMNDKGVLLSDVCDGAYRHLFKLFSVFGYGPARACGMLKRVLPWEEGVNQCRYIKVSGGDSEFVDSGKIIKGEENTQLKHNHPRTNAIIRRAIDEANQITAYDAHVMIRCSGITAVKSLVTSIEGSPSDYFPKNSKGWGVTAIYSGSPGKKINDSNHPWMIVKKKRAATEKSLRLLLTVDLGQFGLNNPYCSVIGWTDPNLSIIELIQRIGRAMRVLLNISIELQNVILVFPDIDKAKKQLEKAIDYILNMDEIISGKFDALDGPCQTVTDISFADPSFSNITSEDRFDINEAHGCLLPDGLSREDIEQIASAIDDVNTEETVNKIQAYVDNLNSEEFKDRQFGLPGSAKPFHYVFREECKTVFELEEMRRYVQANYPSCDIPDIINALDANDTVTIKMIQHHLKEKYMRFHQVSGKFFSVSHLIGNRNTHPSLSFEKDTYYGKLKSYFNVLFDRSDEEEKKRLGSILSKNLFRACQTHFGMTSFKQDDYASFEAQLSSAMCSPRVRSAIVSRAAAMSIASLKDRMPGHFALFVDQISQLLE